MVAKSNTARELLASNVRRIRRERGLTQEMLSHLSGATQGHVSEIEAGKRNASIDLIGAIASSLGVPVAALFQQRGAASDSPTV